MCVSLQLNNATITLSHSVFTWASVNCLHSFNCSIHWSRSFRVVLSSIVLGPRQNSAARVCVCGAPQTAILFPFKTTRYTSFRSLHSSRVGCGTRCGAQQRPGDGGKDKSRFLPPCVCVCRASTRFSAAKERARARINALPLHKHTSYRPSGFSVASAFYLEISTEFLGCLHKMADENGLTEGGATRLEQSRTGTDFARQLV